MDPRVHRPAIIVTAFVLGLGWAFLLAVAIQFDSPLLTSGLVVLVSLLLTIQGIFTLAWMLFAWNNPQAVSRHKSPQVYTSPRYAFTALLPARFEEQVIGETIRAIAAIDYPESLKELLVLCRADDTGTIKKAREAIRDLPGKNIKLLTFTGQPVNKPHSLNIGLRYAGHELITVFDAEDQPHRDIYHIVNTLIATEGVDVVQSGVQLMNFKSHWFSALNVMEYFFWFKSGLQFFSRKFGVTPLGGNTVFFKKSQLLKIGGWDENCLTEDADVGFRLVQAGAGLRVVYDEQHTTREETPVDTLSFIRQRTRWDQGFLQVLSKGCWAGLPRVNQRFLAFYILALPLLQLLIFVYLPFGVWIAFSHKLPDLISLLSVLPLYILFLQIVTYIIGLYEFTVSYKLKFPWWMPLKVVLTFIPYQLLLIISASRAVLHQLRGLNLWEKTVHVNAHRQVNSLFSPQAYAQEISA